MRSSATSAAASACPGFSASARSRLANANSGCTRTLTHLWVFYSSTNLISLT